MDMEEFSKKWDNHEQRIAGLERLQAVLSIQLSSILGVLKWIAGMLATVAGALLLDFIRRNA